MAYWFAARFVLGGAARVAAGGIARVAAYSALSTIVGGRGFGINIEVDMPPRGYITRSPAMRRLHHEVARALNDVATDVVSDLNRQLPRRIDRPTPFTQKAFAILYAKKSNLNATILIKDIQAGYLTAQEYGGTRYPKNAALVVPVNQRLNKYGNLPRGAIKRILARKDTFAGRINGNAGIYQRIKGGRLRMLVAFEPRTKYRPRLKFKETALRTIDKKYDPRFTEALERAMRS